MTNEIATLTEKTRQALQEKLDEQKKALYSRINQLNDPELFTKAAEKEAILVELTKQGIIPPDRLERCIKEAIVWEYGIDWEMDMKDPDKWRVIHNVLGVMEHWDKSPIDGKRNQIMVTLRSKKYPWFKVQYKRQISTKDSKCKVKTVVTRSQVLVCE